MEIEQSRRVVKLIDDNIKGISFDDVLTCEDWEDILCFKETDFSLELCALVIYFLSRLHTNIPVVFDHV